MCTLSCFSLTPAISFLELRGTLVLISKICNLANLHDMLSELSVNIKYSKIQIVTGSAKSTVLAQITPSYVLMNIFSFNKSKRLSTFWRPSLNSAIIIWQKFQSLRYSSPIQYNIIFLHYNENSKYLDTPAYYTKHIITGVVIKV